MSAEAPDPGDAARLLAPWRRFPFPTRWSAVFGRAAPLHLEVGFGDGRFTAWRAREQPGADFVGLEVSGVSARRALQRMRREELGNVRLVKAGAQIAVRQLFAPGALSSITVNFPDPWPKARHARHRLLRHPFLGLAADRLAPAGEVRLATDHDDYAAMAEAEAARGGLFEVRREAPPEAVLHTKYALKWRAQGKGVHYLVFVRTGVPCESVPPLERPSIMPHALLRGRLPSDPTFEKTVLPYGEGHVVLHELARSLGANPGGGPRERLLVRATVDEPDLRQHLLVVVQRREGGELIVRLESFGDPIVTPAVRGAVHGVTEWLRQRGGMEVDARNY